MSTKKSFFEVDLLHGPILRNLVIFMIPIFISNAFQQLYNAVDTALVGNILGENSLASIGACASIFELLVGFSMSMGTGFSIVISKSFGSGDSEKIKKAIGASLVIGFITVVVLTVGSYFGLGPLLHLINTPAEIFEESLLYIRIIGLGLIVMFMYNLFSAILRAIGNSVMPLVFLIVSSVLNIILDYSFMKFFGMGVAGAAIATVIAQGVSAVLSLIYILTKQKQLVPNKNSFGFDKELYSELAGQGYAMAFMGSIVSVGSIILQSGINSLGTEIIAGHVAARKVYAIAMLPFISMGLAVSTFIGQNRGANQGRRILEALKDCYIFDVVCALLVSVILWFTAPTLVHTISGSSNPVIISNGSWYLYIVGPFYCALGMLMVTRFGLQCLGSKWIPLISSVIECVGKILVTIIFIPMFGYAAVMWCEPIIWCLMAAQLIFSFQKNPYIQKLKKDIASGQA